CIAVCRRRLVAKTPLVEPDLPELTSLVVDVAVGDVVRLLVDEQHALAVGVLRLLGDALEHPGVARFPVVAVYEVAAVLAPFHREIFGVKGAEDLLVAEELPGEPGNLAGVAAVAVDVGVLAEERVGALRAGEAADAAQAGQVEPGVVLTIRIQITD